ncbi:MAG: RDD family protein [Spirulina sp. SIO3F2]|nr:RDD family protein [Spirulina sp. SIO3F2]
MEKQVLNYASFWQRAWASLLDFFILCPVIALFFWGALNFKNYFFFDIPISLLISFFYSIYLVKQLGGTLGKLIVGIIITKPDGSPVSWREAILRPSVDIILGLLLSIAFLIASLNISLDDYNALSGWNKIEILIMNLPPWHRPVDIFQNVWVWADLIAVLTNRKRRSLRDRIAGTVVIKQVIPPDLMD